MKLSRLYKHLPKNSLLVGAAVLIAVSFLSAWFFQAKPSVEHHQKLLEGYIRGQQAEAESLLNDTVLLRKLVTHTESKEEFDGLYKKKFGFFLFAETISESQDLLFWNSQEIISPTPNFAPPDSVYFQQLLNGYYVIHKKRIVLPGISSHMMGYALIPVLNKYYLETESAQNGFVHSADAVRRIAIAEGVTPFPVRSVDGGVLFYVDKAQFDGESKVHVVTLALRLFALALLLVYLHLLIEAVRKKRGPKIALALLAVVLLACRLTLFLFPALFSLRQVPLFDPSIYASDSFNRSLGDLLLSALFLCWFMVYAWTNLGPVRRLPSFLRGGGLIAAGVGAIFVLIYTTFQLANAVQNLVTSSKISFDVTNFFSLSVYSVFGFIALALLTLTYYYFSRLLFRFILLAFPALLHLYGAVAVVGLTYLTFRSGNLIVLFHLPVLGWLVIYTLLLSQERLIINRIRMTVAGILFWIFIFSISLAFLIMQGNRAKEWEERKEIAEKYERVNDPTKERSLRIALAYLNNDFLRANFNRFSGPTGQLLRDSIINENSLGFASSYATDVYLFDSARRPVNNLESRSYEELNNIIQTQSKTTGVPELFYYEPSYAQFIYIIKREIKDSDNVKGYFFLLAAPRRFLNVGLPYQNLFIRTGENDIENSPVYAYAIYKERKLLNHSSKYAFTTWLSADKIPEAEFTKRQNGDYDELWFKESNQKIVVVAKKKDTLMESITLFSYLFCAFLFMVGLLRLSALAARLARGVRLSEVFSRLNIRTQIHWTIIFIPVLSFLIIGAATISFFIARYHRSNNDRLSRIAGGAVTEMDKRAAEDSLMSNHVINFSDTSSLRVLRRVVREIADVHGVIVNLYDTYGTLQVTSDEIIYKRGVLSTKMHPYAYYQLNNLNVVQQVQDEKAGQLKYQSIYTAMRDGDGHTYAYLNIPSFTSQIELNQEISNFLVTIINLNAFIFLIAGVVALFITNRITNTFSVIGEKMRAITLGKTAEEIEWTKNDEIGELVRQYNVMVRELEQSAAALAKSEREGAWREMARQVAHEIKNPLTPMKLSIQYLQRAIQTGQGNVQQLTSSVAGTLIEQIDHLSKIAADFSQFANIGNKKVETIDLHTVLRSLVDLYSSNGHIQWQWNPLPEPLWMRTDKTQMNRLFTNLLSNAVDACSEVRSCKVTVNERKDGDDVIVSVSDNGEGIPPDMRSKIFMPNFTTKTSGTGLGLAMCKSIAEGAGGAIWFETEEGKGTTFYVRLPLEDDRQ